MSKLTAIQNELKANKSRYNSFGKYNYRSLEDIFEAVKPLLKKYDATLHLSDELVLIGERYYIKAVAILRVDEDEFISMGYAREAFEKKGMDDSQVTGTASSYARKYALNSLFLIDDTKDADTDEYHQQTNRESLMATETEKKTFLAVCKELGIDEAEIRKKAGVNGKMTKKGYSDCMKILKEISDKVKK